MTLVSVSDVESTRRATRRAQLQLAIVTGVAAAAFCFRAGSAALVMVPVGLGLGLGVAVLWTRAVRVADPSIWNVASPFEFVRRLALTPEGRLYRGATFGSVIAIAVASYVLYPSVWLDCIVVGAGTASSIEFAQRYRVHLEVARRKGAPATD
jgi:hypothetical protein